MDWLFLLGNCTRSSKLITSKRLSKADVLNQQRGILLSQSASQGRLFHHFIPLVVRQRLWLIVEDGTSLGGSRGLVFFHRCRVNRNMGGLRTVAGVHNDNIFIFCKELQSLNIFLQQVITGLRWLLDLRLSVDIVDEQGGVHIEGPEGRERRVRRQWMEKIWSGM